MLDKYGIDVVRLYVLSKAPPDLVLDWNERDILGQQRWSNKFYRLALSLTENNSSTSSKFSSSPEDPLRIRGLVNETISNVTSSLEKNQFHNAISFLIKLLNSISYESNLCPQLTREACSVFARLLFPMAPILASEVWSLLNPLAEPLSQHPWPQLQEDYIQHKNETRLLKVLVQSKFITEIEISSELLDDEQKIFQTALQSLMIQETLQGKSIKKLMFIKKSIVNILI